MMVVSSENFWIWQWSELYLKSVVYRVRELYNNIVQEISIPDTIYYIFVFRTDGGNLAVIIVNRYPGIFQKCNRAQEE